MQAAIEVKNLNVSYGKNKVLDTYVGERGVKLSGGQKQRVFLARALAQDVSLYILDEPLTGVDIKTEDIIANEFKKLQDLGKTILAVHHNIYTLDKYFDNLVVLNRNIKYSGSLYVDNLEKEINKGFRD